MPQKKQSMNASVPFQPIRGQELDMCGGAGKLDARVMPDGFILRGIVRTLPVALIFWLVVALLAWQLL